MFSNGSVLILNETTFTNHNHEHSLTSATNEADLAATRFVVQKLLVPLVTSVGFIGNVISIRVLTHRSMVSSTNCYLTALAIFDILYLLFSFSLSLMHYETIKNDVHYWFPYGKVLTDICSNASVCLTVTFSLERLVAVSYPIKGRVLCTPQRAKMITVIVVLFVIVCTAPEFFESKLVVLEKENKTKMDFEDTTMAKTDAYRIGYYNFYVFIFTILPLILLSTFNGILVKTVYSAIKLRKRMTYTDMRKNTPRRQTEQNRITIMLIGVVIVFLICQSPNAALFFYKMYIDTQSITLSNEGQNNVRIAGNIVNLMVLINASINFILYSVMSTKFRKVCVRICCLCSSPGRDLVITESSYYNGHTLRDSDIPLRFRSQRCSKSGNRNPLDVSLGQSCRSVHFRDERFGTKILLSPNQRCGRGGSSGESNNDSSDALTEDTNFTPIVMRKTGKTKSGNGTGNVTHYRQLKAEGMAPDRDQRSGNCEIYQANMIQIQMVLNSRTNVLKCDRHCDTAV